MFVHEKKLNVDIPNYLTGGASEIALSIIPVIEAAGGRVLVKANVTGKVRLGCSYIALSIIPVIEAAGGRVLVKANATG